MTTYNVSNLDNNASVVTVTSQGPQGADAVLQAGNRGDFTVAIAGNGSQTATINTGAVTSDKILDGTILNVDINASAGIDFSKLATGALPTAITVTTGNITDNSITSPKIAALTENLKFNDNVRADFGTDRDFRIFHTGTNALLRNTVGNIEIQPKMGENGIKLIPDGSVQLFHDGSSSPKIETTSTGIDVTGNIVVSGLVDSVDIAARDTLFGGLTSSSGVLTNGVTATTQSASDNSNKVATTAYTDTAISNLVNSAPSTLDTLKELSDALGSDANFSTTVTNSIATKLSLSGGTIDGNVTLNDGKELFFGTDNDFKIKHSGALADIVNTTGNLRLETGTGNNILFRTDDNDGTHTNIIICDGTTGSEHVDLYHSGNRRLATLDDGVRVIGKLQTGFEGDLPTLSSQTRAVFSGSFTTGETQNSTSAISILCKGGANSRINLGTDSKEDQAQIKFRNENNDIQFLVTDPSDNSHNVQLEVNSDTVDLHYAGVKKAETSATGFDVSGFLNTTHSTNGYSLFKTEDAGSGLKIASKTASSVANLVFSNNHSGTLANNWFIQAGVVSSNYSFTVGKGDIDGTTATPMLQISDKVELHYADTLNASGSIRAQTSSTGFDITGGLSISHTNPFIAFDDTDHSTSFKLNAGGGILQLQVSSNNGASYTNAIGIGGVGNIFIPDNDKVNFGSGNDLTIVHDGTDSKITNTTGNLKIESKTDQLGIQVIPDNAVELYYSGTKTAQTSSTGFDITGDLKLTGDISSEDKFITLANIATPTDTQAANSGLYIKGTTDKHFRYQNGNNSFNSTENITIAADKKLRFQSKFEIFNSSGIGENNHDSGATNFDNTVAYSQDDKVINNHRVYQAQATISSGQGAPTHTSGTSGNWSLLGFVNATAFDVNANYTQGALVLNGNKIYQADFAISAQTSNPVHSNGSSHNWRFVRIADGEAGQYIKDASTGPLKLLSDQVIIKNTNDNKTSASFSTNGAAKLFHNNVLTLETTGNGITVTGTVTESSDVALKENIQPLSNVLEKVKQLTGYKYNFKNTTNNSMGVIAQDVEKVFPELVHGKEGEKSLQYSGLIGALIESIKELSAKVAVLENQ